MANTDNPRGFEAVGHVNGGVIREAQFEILYSYGTALFRGDAVIFASGYVNKAADSSSAILGVFNGCEYVDDSGTKVYSQTWPGVALADSAKKVTAHVYVDPGIIFRVQTDTGTASTIANVGVAYDIELDHSGATATGQSGMELDLGDTGTGQFKIIGLDTTVGNAWGTNSKVLVVNAVPVF
jgi:hypothetical protein